MRRRRRDVLELEEVAEKDGRWVGVGGAGVGSERPVARPAEDGNAAGHFGLFRDCAEPSCKNEQHRERRKNRRSQERSCITSLVSPGSLGSLSLYLLLCENWAVTQP